MRCGYCGSPQHPISHCPKTWAGSARYAQLRCTYCGGRDHNYEACQKHMGDGKMDGAVRIVKPLEQLAAAVERAAAEGE